MKSHQVMQLRLSEFAHSGWTMAEWNWRADTGCSTAYSAARMLRRARQDHPDQSVREGALFVRQAEDHVYIGRRIPVRKER